ncbi:unnamed protein product [Rotaria sp. Silwood1]|nr:unnamed protein product [Rotaria sp. Silwood1]
MAFSNDSRVIGVLAHGIIEITQPFIDSDHADEKYMEYLPYPDNNFHEIIDNRDKFIIEHIHRRTGQAFVSNVRVHVISIVTKHTVKCSATFIDPYFIQDKNNEYPCFPTRNNQIAFTNDSIVDEHYRLLIDYLNKVLRHPKFRAHPATCEFFDVSCLSFIRGLSIDRKEGYLLEKLNDYHCDHHAFFHTRYYCDLCKCHDGPKWFVIKDSYIVDIQLDTHEVCFPMLVDREFQVLTGIHNTDNDDSIKINNLQRTLVIKCSTAHDCDEWAQHLSNLTEQAKDFVSALRSRFNSYTPVRENQLAYWFINGKSYMEAVVKALLIAKEEVFITDWWLSPEVMLIRPTDDETFRLDNILGRIADAGVRVYVMLFKEMSFVLALNSLYTKETLVSKSYSTSQIAFIGGIDLCYGRWDDEHMRLIDLGDKNDTKLKSSFDIVAENVASGGRETVEAAQITTMQMAEQAGEISVKSLNCLRAAFNPLNEATKNIGLSDSTDASGTAYDIKSIDENRN